MDLICPSVDVYNLWIPGMILMLKKTSTEINDNKFIHREWEKMKKSEMTCDQITEFLHKFNFSANPQVMHTKFQVIKAMKITFV